MPVISSNTDPVALANAEAPDAASSQYREQNIQEYLLACGGTDGLSVICKPSIETAYIEQDRAEKAPTIYIPARDFDQPVSNYPQVIATRLMQYGLALHEHGHDRYTDGAYLKEKFDRLPLQVPQAESFYWSLVNGIEDHRIEAALINEEGDWALQRLQFVSENLAQARIEDCESPHNITWASGLSSAVFHYGKGREQSNVLPVLLDDSDSRLQWRSDTDKHLYHWLVPELKSVLTAAATEPQPKEAAQIELEFVRTLDEFLAEISPPSRDEKQEQAMGGGGDDKQNDMGGSKEEAESLSENDSNGESNAETETDESCESAAGGEPETDEKASQSTGSDQSADGEDAPQGSDAGGTAGKDKQTGSPSNQSQSEGEGEPQADGESTSQGSQQNGRGEHPDDQSSTETSPDGAGEDTQAQTGGGNPGDKTGEVSDTDTDNSQPGESEPSETALTEEEVSVRERRRVTAEKQKVQRDKETLEREIEQLRQALDAGEGGVKEFELYNQTGKTMTPETWSQIESEARRLKPPLQNALQRSQKTNEQRGTRVGRFDSKLGYRLATNNLSVNKRTTHGEQKQYSVVVVLDRSVSMKNQITEAEIAAGGFVKALEEIGVTVALIDLYQDTARMVKPFHSPTDRAKGGLTNGDTGGTTPLSDALILSRERVRQGDHYPFMVVVSDGSPNDKEVYLEELSKTTFPVVGINITESGTLSDGFRECYDVCEGTRSENLSHTLSTVAQRVIF